MRIYPFFLAAAGCPGRCLYCRQELAAADAAPDPAAVPALLDGMLPARGDGEVAFFGGSFTRLPPARQRAYLTAVAPFIAAGRVAGIRISTRPDALASEQIGVLVDGGVTTVEVGAQSFSAAVLCRAGRGYTPRCSVQALRRLRQSGVAVGIQLMPYLPGGDRREALASLKVALRLAPDFVRIYPTVVLAATPLAELTAAGGYRPVSLHAAVDCAAEMLWRCRRQGVPVIRLGLQPTAELAAPGAVLGGGYHPAFGQLVRSRLWLRGLVRSQPGEGGTFRVAPGDLADAIGHRRHNLVQLQRRWPQMRIVADPQVARGTFVAAAGPVALTALNLYPER